MYISHQLEGIRVKTNLQQQPFEWGNTFRTKILPSGPLCLGKNRALIVSFNH